MAARAKTLLLLLAAVCLPAFAHVPRAPFVVQKPHQGVERLAQGSHRGPGAANSLTAPGFCECLYDKGGRSRSTAKERDEESGLDYFGARYMSSALGRFTSADAPFADQRAGDPQSWNLYGYTSNNPLAYVDPTGRAKTKAIAAVIKKLQVGFRQITVRHDKAARSLSLRDARDRVQSGGEAIFEGRGGAQKASGRDAIYHDAHTATAGDDALPHLHPVDAKGKKKSGHAFIREASQKVIIPGAAAGTALFGDNLLGATADFVNPVAEAQDVFEIMETSVIPTIFGFVDEYLLSPPSPPQDQSESSAQQSTAQQQACQQQQDCRIGP